MSFNELTERRQGRQLAQLTAKGASKPASAAEEMAASCFARLAAD